MQASTGPYFSSVVRGGHPVCPRLDVPVLHDQKKKQECIYVGHCQLCHDIDNMQQCCECLDSYCENVNAC